MTAPEISDEELLNALSDVQREQLTGYIDRLLEANTQFNLTAVRNRDDAWERHVVESLRLTPASGHAPQLAGCGQWWRSSGNGSGNRQTRYPGHAA